MSKYFRLPGFPSPDKQDVVRFHLLKSLPYSTRMLLYVSCIVAGFVVQILMMTVLPGAFLLIFAALLNLVKGYKVEVRLDSFKAGSDWTQVDMQKLREVEACNEKLTKWDKDTMDISNSTGCLVFILAILGVAFASFALGIFSSDNQVIKIFIADAIILILPLWFNGLRQIHKQDKLCNKIALVRDLESFFNTICKDGEHFNPQLMLATDKNGKRVPMDCRFMISSDDMPEGFYGVQAQINVNTVEGKDYPYFYCVLAAKKGFGLQKYVSSIPVPKAIITEFKSERDADVIVIRQYTTKTSGYHTKINACKSILERALAASRIVLEQTGKQSQ